MEPNSVINQSNEYALDYANLIKAILAKTDDDTIASKDKVIRAIYANEEARLYIRILNIAIRASIVEFIHTMIYKIVDGKIIWKYSANRMEHLTIPYMKARGVI